MSPKLNIEKLLSDYIKDQYAFESVKILSWQTELDSGVTTYWVRYEALGLTETQSISILNLIAFVYGQQPTRPLEAAKGEYTQG